MIESQTFYDGSIDMVFEPRKHQYFVGDDQVPSVTQVTGVMSKPALRRWYGNTVADYFKNRLSPGMELDEIIIEEIYKDSKSAPFKTRDKAGDLGTLVHAEIENYLEAIIRGGKYETSLVNQKARSAYERFVGWWVESGYTPIATETMIYHREFNYAGTFDILAEDADGRTVVLDIKTSKGVYDEHFAQMAAYAMALWDGCLPQFEIKAFPSTAVVHVPVATEKLAIKTSKNDIDTDCEGFIAMRQLYKWSKGI